MGFWDRRVVDQVMGELRRLNWDQYVTRLPNEYEVGLDALRVRLVDGAWLDMITINAEWFFVLVLADDSGRPQVRNDRHVYSAGLRLTTYSKEIARRLVDGVAEAQELLKRTRFEAEQATMIEAAAAAEAEIAGLIARKKAESEAAEAAATEARLIAERLAAEREAAKRQHEREQADAAAESARAATVSQAQAFETSRLEAEKEAYRHWTEQHSGGYWGNGSSFDPSWDQGQARNVRMRAARNGLPIKISAKSDTEVCWEIKLTSLPAFYMTEPKRGTVRFHQSVKVADVLNGSECDYEEVVPNIDPEDYVTLICFFAIQYLIVPAVGRRWLDPNDKEVTTWHACYVYLRDRSHNVYQAADPLAKKMMKKLGYKPELEVSDMERLMGVPPEEEGVDFDFLDFTSGN